MPTAIKTDSYGQTFSSIVIPAKAGIQSAASAAQESLMPRGRAALDPAFQRDDVGGLFVHRSFVITVGIRGSFFYEPSPQKLPPI
jgi:hypothetical protein